jgi:CheY-like chemotaxis protein
MKTILIVDDDDSFRSMVVTMLQREGYATMEEDSGFNAFVLANTQMPDLIISDVMMYSGSGFMLREFLTQQERTASIPMILMTGAAQNAGAWESEPAIDYLLKPFSDAELLAAVKRKLGPGSTS